jgi:hypothetical protein
LFFVNQIATMVMYKCIKETTMMCFRLVTNLFKTLYCNYTIHSEA